MCFELVTTRFPYVIVGGKVVTAQHPDDIDSFAKKDVWTK
jgi:hypothetical protein